MSSPDIAQLMQLAPVAVLSPARIKELASLCFIEKVSRDIDPLRMNVMQTTAQSLYLLKGDLGLRFVDGSKKILRGATDAASHPVNNGKAQLLDSIALTDIEILRIDADLLDIMITWDQLSGEDSAATKPQGIISAPKRAAGEWMRDTSAFGAKKLHSGVFSQLPSANIEEMFNRLTPLPVKAGQVIITQGAEGDYYYLIEQGTAVVSRMDVATQHSAVLAELGSGDAFGEEALVSDNKRNATVTMKTDGLLLRLNKQDFIELLKAPLINQVDMQAAQQMVGDGAVWLDVRFPSEYAYDHLPEAVSAPLNEIRRHAETMDKKTPYIVYCQTGRRASAAAFILVGMGFKVFVLEGGIRAGRR
ncbi:MAG: cyclic nucleotide-binding protein [Betaproteobacteria bacterium HGW-Betaproteobacteria-2]|nr:MAG: cyclic nucleotide-binding protein [Betaproteobacteria bacterium HGW-Betaproteobacteria-2]